MLVNPSHAEYIGQTFSRLTIKSIDYRDVPTRKRIPYAVCECICGESSTTQLGGVKSGRVSSCGCLQKERSREAMRTVGKANRKHGMSHGRFHRIWAAMKRRCDSQKDKDYGHYGGRGITYQESWSNFENFYRDMHSTYEPHLTIERVDVNGNYEVSNCTWIPKSEQSKNRRNVKGRKKV